MSNYTRAELDKLSQEALNQKAMKNLNSVSIFLNQLRSLTYRIKDKDTLETIHASLTKNKIYINQLLERIDNIV